MSPDDLQRTMQFLLTQQAQFAADLERLSGKTDRMADALIGLTGLVGRVADAVDRHVDTTHQQLQRLADQVENLATHVSSAETQIGEVGSHLDVVIDMFERHLREDPGHRPS